jgi:hypothetical protein
MRIALCRFRCHAPATPCRTSASSRTPEGRLTWKRGRVCSSATTLGRTRATWAGSGVVTSVTNPRNWGTAVHAGAQIVSGAGLAPPAERSDRPQPPRGVGRVYGAHRRRRVMRVSAAILVVLLAGLAAGAIASASESAPTNWPRNASGQTYGSGLLARSPADEPDIIRVEATNGKTGYSLRVDLEGPSPRRPRKPCECRVPKTASLARFPCTCPTGRQRLAYSSASMGR